jgi:benzodiazapine receptor
MDKQKVKNIGLFIGCLILCQAAGGIGTIATIPNIPTWYASLNKPSFQPPNWLFGPVWTILYTIMAVVLYILIRSDHPIKRKAIAVFSAQLILNAIWSFLFFEYHLLAISLAEILLLLATLIYFTIIVRPISRTAMYCFLPYIAWVSFASLLNAGVWYLNK